MRNSNRSPFCARKRKRSSSPGLPMRPLMAQGGARMIRFPIDWRDVQAHAEAPFDWTQTDRYVGKAANHGVSALPILFATPGWLSVSYI